jgi:hypothetical protein
VKFGGRTVDDAIFDSGAAGVIHGRGGVQRREQVERRHPEVRRGAGGGGRGRAGTGRAVARGSRLRATNTTTTTNTTRRHPRKEGIRNANDKEAKQIHGGNSNQFIDFREPHDALIYIVAGTKRGVADGVGPNKIGDAPGVEREHSKIGC